jgi:hypothetical protein
VQNEDVLTFFLFWQSSLFTSTMTWSLEDFKEFFLGDAEKYKYGSLCMPTLPWTKTVNKPKVPFYSKGKKVEILARRNKYGQLTRASSPRP